MSDLTSLLFEASEGERSDLISFLKAFREATLIVPEKEQSPAFEFLPKYPDRPLNILAVPDDKVTTVPAFTELSLVEKWSNRLLKVRSISTRDLINLLPDDWWITLNPGDDVRKDFSPWELKRLLGGDEELEEIATDLEQERGVEPLQVRKLGAEEYPDVRRQLSKLAEESADIQEVFIAIEEAETVEGNAVETLLVGLKIKDLPPPEAEQIRSMVKSTLSPLLIGAIQLRVLLGVGFSDLELGVFADIPADITSM